jgi:citrate synthase
VVNIDQRGFVNQRSTYLGGREAAAFLGVKRETLYAYASRGLVRSEPGEGGRERRYQRDDLERLKAKHDARSGHGAVAAGAMRWGEPVLESALTAITLAGPVYRGFPAAKLARAETPFEAVAEMLWASDPPRSGATALDVAPRWKTKGFGVRVPALMALLPAESRPVVALAVAVPAMGAVDPERFEAIAEVDRARARVLILRLAALTGIATDRARAVEALKAGSVPRALLSSLGARGGEKAERAVNRALVMSADHELNPSTFAVRIAASTQADLYACVSAGLSTLSGPRHGGECDRVEALVHEVGSPARARSTIQERARRGERIPGFGHSLYPQGDPRALVLIETALAIGRRSAGLQTALALVEAMGDSGRGLPTLDIGLVAVAAALGLPPGSAAAIFAVGRTAGWIAHVLEQRIAGFLLRPRARYIGPETVMEG